MDLKSKLFFERLKYRTDNSITGGYYKFNFVNKKIIKIDENPDKQIIPIGICLHTNKKYFILEDPMNWTIDSITDNETIFEEDTKDHYAGEKGKFRNIDCWFVLNELQNDLYYQNWCLLLPSITKSFNEQKENKK